jgi:CHAD domain-containing protein
MQKRFSAGNVAPQFREIARTIVLGALKTAGESGKPARDRVHGARTRIKKLRALLRLVRPGFPAFAFENATARDAARMLAPLRDNSVLEQTLQYLQKNSSPDGLAALGEAIDAHAPPPLDQEQELDAFARALRPMLERIDGWMVEGDDLRLLADGATRTYRAGRRALKRARKRGRPDDFHEWRKQVKHQMYELAFMRDLPDPPTERIEHLKELASTLGLHHDLVAFVTFATGEGKVQFAAMIETADKERGELEDKALNMGDALFDVRSGQWGSQLSAASPAPPEV